MDNDAFSGPDIAATDTFCSIDLFSAFENINLIHKWKLFLITNRKLPVDSILGSSRIFSICVDLFAL